MHSLYQPKEISKKSYNEFNKVIKQNGSYFHDNYEFQKQ